MPMPASSRPRAMEMMVLCLSSRPRPDEGTEGEEVHREEFRRPELQREARDLGARKVMSRTATSEPMKDEVNAAVSASAASPCWAIG